jgi:capsular polysaccharide biosynthesis protein
MTDHRPSLQDIVREYAIFVLGSLWRNWKLLAAPVALTIGLATLASMILPKTYTSKSLILFQSANRPVGSGVLAGAIEGQAALEQINAVEAWLKSDQVMLGLLPQLTDPKDLDTPDKLAARAETLRRSLTLSLVGGSALEISLAGGSPKGLGDKLEIILARLMEGLTGPEQGIFNAPQFILLRRTQALAATDSALNNVITLSGATVPEKTRALLTQLYDLEQQRQANEAAVTVIPASTADQPDPQVAPAPQPQADVKALRQDLSSDPQMVDRLQAAYSAFAAANRELDLARNRLPSRGNNYVGIFNSPENLLIVGRPKDPLYGESSVRKLAIAGILMSLGLGAALIFLAERLDRRLRTQDQFVRVSGLPVVGRLRKVTV